MIKLVYVVIDLLFPKFNDISFVDPKKKKKVCISNIAGIIVYYFTGNFLVSLELMRLYIYIYIYNRGISTIHINKESIKQKES